MGLPRGGDAHLPKREHRQSVVEHRRVMPGVVEDEGFQSEQVLTIDVTIEIDAEAWLVIVAGGVAANADAGVAKLHALPFEIDRVVRAFLVVRVEVLPVSRIDVKPDIVQRAAVEERVSACWGARRLRQTQHRGTQRDAKHEHERSNPQPAHPLSYNPNSMRN